MPSISWTSGFRLLTEKIGNLAHHILFAQNTLIKITLKKDQREKLRLNKCLNTDVYVSS